MYRRLATKTFGILYNVHRNLYNKMEGSIMLNDNRSTHVRDHVFLRYLACL